MGSYDTDFLGNIIEAIFRITASAFVKGYDGMDLWMHDLILCVDAQMIDLEASN